jgi:hypothetical protein
MSIRAADSVIEFAEQVKSCGANFYACQHGATVQVCSGARAAWHDVCSAPRQGGLEVHTTVGRGHNSPGPRNHSGFSETDDRTEGCCPECGVWSQLAWQPDPEPGGLWWLASAGCPACGALVLVETECERRELPAWHCRGVRT